MILPVFMIVLSLGSMNFFADGEWFIDFDMVQTVPTHQSDDGDTHAQDEN